MKLIRMILPAAFIVLLLTGCRGTGNEGPTTLLRTTGPAGGLIFYVDTADEFAWDYMEAAPADHSSNLEWAVGSGLSTLIGTPETGIGFGLSNTNAIVQYHVDNSIAGDYAAKVCADLVVSNNGTDYDEWFLPSADEMNEMYVNLGTYGVGNFEGYDLGGTPAYRYWSSSEHTSITNQALFEYLDQDSDGSLIKSNAVAIRAARYVTLP